MNDREPIPLTWDEALEKHIDIKKSEDAAESTLRSHKSRLGIFIDWVRKNPLLTAEEDDGPRLETTDQLHRKHLQDYRLKRADEVNTKTLKTQMDTLRVFIRNLEDYGAVREGLRDHVRSPSLKGDEGQRSDHLPVERGNPIREHLRQYEWATLMHVVYELYWGTGMRIGDAHSIDVPDIHLDENYIDLTNRPDTGTRLKNGNDSERPVAITDTVCDAIRDFLDHPDRPDDCEDEHGREPLFVNESGGRICKQTLRTVCYEATQPCMITGECPHDRDVDECRAASNRNYAYDCPDVKAPHAVRSGAITRMRENDVPPWIISERVDASEEVIERHYNEMSDKDKMELRRQYFNDEYED